MGLVRWTKESSFIIGNLTGMAAAITQDVYGYYFGSSREGETKVKLKQWSIKSLLRSAQFMAVIFCLYEQAKRDAIKYEEAKRKDPWYGARWAAIVSKIMVIGILLPIGWLINIHSTFTNEMGIILPISLQYFIFRVFLY